jgi:hypothetical protein
MFSYAQKKISGIQSGTLGPGKYIVTGNIKIETGKCLIIAPGTTFIHDSGNYIWEIHGSFKAIGTQKDSIYFLSKEGVEQNKHWSGLRFLEGSPAAILDYCVIDNAFIHPDFDAMINEYLSAVNVWKGKGITIKHSRISNNYSTYCGGGIYVYDSFVFIDSCNISHNYQANLAKGVGIFLENSNNSKIMNSVIAYNTCNLNVFASDGGGSGIHCMNSNTIIFGCLIYKNSSAINGGGIMANKNCIVTLKSNTIAYNIVSTENEFLEEMNLPKTPFSGGIAAKGKAKFIGKNNIIYANTSPEIGNNTRLIYSCTSKKISGKGNIFNAPLFINPKKDNFSLKSNSPSINKGRKQDGTTTNMGAL